MIACRDCKHFSEEDMGWYCNKYKRPFNGYISGISEVSMDCFMARGMDGPCGPEAKGFEERSDLFYKIRKALK